MKKTNTKDEPTKKRTADSFLIAARKHMFDRAGTYDKPGDEETEGERSMSQTVAAFNAITGQNITEAEGWLLLQVLKDVRQWATIPFHVDSAEDCVAFAALKAEALAEGK